MGRESTCCSLTDKGHTIRVPAHMAQLKVKLTRRRRTVVAGGSTEGTLHRDLPGALGSHG
jgi:hypothetical protein